MCDVQRTTAATRRIYNNALIGNLLDHDLHVFIEKGMESLYQ